MSCIFCRIVKGEIPAINVAETAKTLAFMDLNPLSDGHVLVIPKTHAQYLHQLPDDSMADLGPVLRRVAAAIGAKDYNILQNNGSLAHQEVPHVHFHVIPKTNASEGLGVGWPAKQTSKEALTAIADRIKLQMPN
jgi:diadenosine tetraphosphate (Ap4A) HIT family hydrolase